MCGRDRATCIGAKYMDDAVEVTTEEEEKRQILLLQNNMSTFVINKLCNWALPNKKE